MKKYARLLVALLTFAMMISVLAGCGGGDDTSTKNHFSWWITTTDGYGTYYEVYEDNPAIQWLNQQYWNNEEGGLGTSENGSQLKLSFIAPIAGAEADNFNTMMATGEYPEIIDMSYAGSAQTLYAEGYILDITEYVQNYMPNYMKLLEENPELMPFVSNLDENGNTQFLTLASIQDGLGDPWQGYVYRRDWVVQYAQPTEYVWDWESDYVKEHGHPEVTPLEEAVSQENLTGWKRNEVTHFEANDGDDPDNTYSDNVIFPSGRSDPYTISDWEWMFEAFAKAIEERGWADDKNAYCTTLYYTGATGMGEIVSSFGGGNGAFYKNANNEVSYDGISDNNRLFLETMHTWYENGWIDTVFETRSSDSFFAINQNGFSQGKVGLWCGTYGYLGDLIRTTCLNETDKENAFVMACPLPINDKYGTAEQQHKNPDCLYQGSRVGLQIALTEKCEGKDLETLFTMLDWLYTEEGALVSCAGLSAEQYASVTLDPDIYAEYGLTSAYHFEEDPDGTRVVVRDVDASLDLATAIKCQRLSVGQSLTGNGADLDYRFDNGYSRTVEHAMKMWNLYMNTGSILEYINILNDTDLKAYNKTDTYMREAMSQIIPKFIKSGFTDAEWESYCTKAKKYNVEGIAEILQKYVDLAN